MLGVSASVRAWCAEEPSKLPLAFTKAIRELGEVKSLTIKVQPSPSGGFRHKPVQSPTKGLWFQHDG